MNMNYIILTEYVDRFSTSQFLFNLIGRSVLVI